MVTYLTDTKLNGTNTLYIAISTPITPLSHSIIQNCRFMIHCVTFFVRLTHTTHHSLLLIEMLF